MSVVRSISGTIAYTSTKPERQGATRGREYFRIDVHGDGSRTIAAHGEIDDAPAVVRDVNLRVGADRRPLDCFVRICVGGAFTGSAWFRFGQGVAECEAFTAGEGRFSQRMAIDGHLPAFGNHAMINDGFLLGLYDLSQGPDVQVTRGLLLSSPDHRGATGPMLFGVDLAIEYVGPERIEVGAGAFDALHFRMVDVPGLPLEHPPYDLWCTSDGDYVLLKAAVGGYMQTAYELAACERTGEAR
ncbi:hypothetical protein [Sphingomonas sp.]|uniref:hypothetical protein n=1 Tax=Sphingomonas sp. TaxID=28214 RepID=UPI002DB6D21A|nr:hypothetical protein [Sphingomonas sp.]HEU4970169.1 hypothetical protein [Sphingomonas sp.]